MPEVVKIDEPEILIGNALAVQTGAEINQQIATAKQYPRTISEVRNKIKRLATEDQATAESCWYTLPRGGKVIEGPSVRLAEIVASSYQNLRVAARVVEIGDKFLTAQAVCMDLENNVAVQTEVKRRITNRNGQRYDDDMITVTSNAACSIALRNAVFKVVPMVLFKGLLADVKLVAMGDERTFTETRKAVLTRLGTLGVKGSQIVELTGKAAPADLDMQDVAMLQGIVNAIQDGDTTVAEAFKPERAKPEAAAVSVASIKAGKPEDYKPHAEPVKTPATPAKSPEPEPVAEPVEEQPAEDPQGEEPEEKAEPEAEKKAWAEAEQATMEANRKKLAALLFAMAPRARTAWVRSHPKLGGSMVDLAGCNDAEAVRSGLDELEKAAKKA